VNALQLGGLDMRGSCCGHGKTIGDIDLQDGRVLLILDAETGKQYMAADVEERGWILKRAIEECGAATAD
jgi:hypothetical protein